MFHNNIVFVLVKMFDRDNFSESLFFFSASDIKGWLRVIVGFSA